MNPSRSGGPDGSRDSAEGRVREELVVPVIEEQLQVEKRQVETGGGVRVRKTVPDAWLEITLHEGRNRIVRRIFGSIGFPVKRLVRTQIGPIKLGDLKSGTYRVLSQAEVRSLSKAVGL